MENNDNLPQDSSKIKIDNNSSISDFKKSYGEDFSNTIDIDTWRMGENLADLYPLIEQELIKAKQDEAQTHQTFREQVFPRIKELQNVPHAGLHDDVNSTQLIEKIQRGFLFNKAVTACGSVSAVYNSVPISITQIGVCLVNYQEQHGSYSHRLFRRDLRFKNEDPIKEAIALIEKRKGDESANDNRKGLSEIAIRGIKAYAERSILLEKSDSNWLMGKGSPVPNDLMRGFWSSQTDMKNKSIALMREMITNHKKFVYVQDSSRNPELWTFGNALRPYEYLIIDNIKDNLTHRLATGGMRGEFLNDYTKFVEEVGPQVAIGVYRVSTYSPPQIFYGHIDHIQTAALIAMADSTFQIHTGTPMLLDLADNLCKTAFGKSDFIASIEQASAKADILLKK
ncbi:hypothetical protein MH928_04460 [Flavobacterium sp. WW92]|uniref:hypothetical protein n=1 Tax=unclassified Flavobacterium TaxID=196869 RepID=UPI0022254813|nr:MULTISPECIES: hypothetical protein [unclassified Flavobacterium]WDO13955.1 hypothetical protein MH928_04460 [Flavobacterium sp. WW92]